MSQPKYLHHPKRVTENICPYPQHESQNTPNESVPPDMLRSRRRPRRTEGGDVQGVNIGGSTKVDSLMDAAADPSQILLQAAHVSQ